MLFKVWIIFTSSSTGKKQYYNIITDKSQYQRPDNIDEQVEGYLPSDWVEVKDDKTYYFLNQKTGETTYSGSMIIPPTNLYSLTDPMQEYMGNIPVAFNDISRENTRLKVAFGKDFKYEPLVITGCLKPIKINGYLSSIRYPIKSLSIKDCKIDDETISLISKLPTLTSLTIGWNSIGDEGAKALSKLTNLTSLDISYNQIGPPEGAKALSKLTNLTSLDIGYNDIGDEGAQDISKLKGLTSLDISYNMIGPEGAKAIIGLTRLTSLKIGQNYIGPEGAQAIRNMHKLTSLDI